MSASILSSCWTSENRNKYPNHYMAVPDGQRALSARLRVGRHARRRSQTSTLIWPWNSSNELLAMTETVPMTWRELYAIARSLRQRADQLFDRRTKTNWPVKVSGARCTTRGERWPNASDAPPADLSTMVTCPGAVLTFPGDIGQRKRQLARGPRALHRHFYNSNLDCAAELANVVARWQRSC